MPVIFKFPLPGVCPTQLIPSLLVIIRPSEVPVSPPTATNELSSEAHKIALHGSIFVPVRATQVVPFVEVMTPMASDPPAFWPTAQNSPRSEDQHTSKKVIFAGVARSVQLVPSGLVNARFVPLVLTAQNRFNSGDQQMPFHVLATGIVRVIQLLPSELVMNAVPAAAQNKFNSGDQHTAEAFTPAVLVVQLIPSGEVITRVAPNEDTATNKLSSADQQTEAQLLLAEVLVVQVMPSGDVITREVPLDATATNSSNSGDQQTEFQLLSTVVCVTQVTPPSSDV